ncbi:DUF1850 domain-containing protein [Pelagibacterium limicola]|uniref:DUF1850 domain-containing protein n=1 Tax=Pelagibacterium limicola TaxID=2791022 RepID=UPI001FE40A0A|nr:DUF1850 domain-containing protein [Pelagibacterium limicola]
MTFAANLLRAGIVLALSSTLMLADEPGSLAMLDTEGKELLTFPVKDGDRWCLHWNHSVAGFLVRDCFMAVDGRMMLERSHQPDIAAGLGHIPGRGTMTSAPEGGYWIETINEFVPGNCLRLRVGSMAVNHRLIIGSHEESLSEIAARQPVRIVLRPVGAEGESTC